MHSSKSGDRYLCSPVANLDHAHQGLEPRQFDCYRASKVLLHVRRNDAEQRKVELPAPRNHYPLAAIGGGNQSLIAIDKPTTVAAAEEVVLGGLKGLWGLMVRC